MSHVTQVFPANALMPIIPGGGVMRMIVHPPIDPAGLEQMSHVTRE